MSAKQTVTPLERGTKKMDVLMRTFGMRTRIFMGSSIAIVKGTRKMYPYELKATIVETARGIGIKVASEKIWYSFFKLIPFLFILTLSILQFVIPTIGVDIANAIGVNVFLLFLGKDPNIIGLWVILPLFSALVIGAELVERRIRSNFIQNRMPRFISGAEWRVAEPPLALDFVLISHNLLWLSWLFLTIIFAPFIFSQEIVENFVQVYNTTSDDLMSKALIVSTYNIAIISGFFFALLFQRFLAFRGELDQTQNRTDIELEGKTRQMMQTVLGAAFLAFIQFVFFSFTFWSNITVFQTILFFAITIIASAIGTWLFWQKELYVFVVIQIWLFLSLVVMVFLNAEQPGYSWMIICHLFLILLILGLMLNRSFEKHLEKKGLLEPSWLFDVFPLFAYIGVIRKQKSKVDKDVKKDLQEIADDEGLEVKTKREDIKVNLKKVYAKGNEAKEILKVFRKIVTRVSKAEVNLLTITTMKNEVKDLLKPDKELTKDADIFFSTVDQLLWDDSYQLREGNVIAHLGEKIYSFLSK